LKEYNRCCVEDQEEQGIGKVQELSNTITQGIKAEKITTRFHKWIITSMNDDIAPVGELSAEEIELDDLYKWLRILHCKISVCSSLEKNLEELQNQENNLEQQTYTLLTPFQQGKQNAEAEFSAAPQIHIFAVCHFT